MAGFFSLLGLNSIQKCIISMSYTSHFIHSSVDRHLGCFHTLSIVNNGSMKIGIYRHLFETMISFSWDIRMYLQKWDSWIIWWVLFLISWGTSILFFIMNFPVNISLPAFISFLFDNNHTNILEKAMASHSSTLAWRIPWTEEPGRLQSLGSLRVGHDWATSLSPFTLMRWRRKWQPTPVFMPGESQGWGSLVGCRLCGRTGSDMTEAT